MFPQNNFRNSKVEKKAALGASYVIFFKIIQFILRIIGTIILARMLTPTDFGLVGMVLAFTSFFDRFRELGLSAAAVQAPKISQEQISNLFWINISISLGITIIIWIIAPFLSFFYEKPELYDIALALAPVSLCYALSIQHRALLRRNLKFFKLGVVDMSGLLVGLGFAIYLAKIGFGYWAIVASNLIQPLVLSITAWYLIKWKPLLPKRGVGTKKFFKFGMAVIFYGLINQGLQSIDKILIGRILGASEVGIYSKARYFSLDLQRSFIQMPANMVNLPALSRLQNEISRMKTYYLNMVQLMAFILIPIMAFLFSCSYEIVNVVLGKQWLACAPIIKVMAICGIIIPISETASTLLISRGKMNLLNKFSVLYTFVTVIGLIIGLKYGLLGMAVSYTLVAVIFFPPKIIVSTYSTDLNLKCILDAIKIPFFGGISIVTTINIVRFFIYEKNEYNLLVALIVGMITYIGIILIFEEGRNILKVYYIYLLTFFLKHKRIGK